MPTLISIALLWAERDAHSEGDAPIHAWRALAQLGAVEAVEPLLGMLNALSARMDDWYVEEFPTVFALIGPEAIPMLAAYLADPGNREYPRVAAADGLKEIALMHAGARDEVVALLTKRLESYDSNQCHFNAFVVADLLDLHATESAELIERAYAAGQVDEWVVGGRSAVRQELGVRGIGIAPDRFAEPEPILSVLNHRVGESRLASHRAVQTKQEGQTQESETGPHGEPQQKVTGGAPSEMHAPLHAP